MRKGERVRAKDGRRVGKRKEQRGKEVRRARHTESDGEKGERQLDR